MRKFLFVITVMAFAYSGFAKKVKFSVDMAGVVTSTNGVHVMGTFQTAAGYTANLDPALTLLTQEGTSTIYSIIVTIPAFLEYEYTFINGDKSYEVEFVPLESRVDIWNANRWLYVDSLKNDTTDVGAVMFSGNAPAGKSLIRFLVDMHNTGTVSNKGVHVAGNFQTNQWNTKNNIMYSFGIDTIEVIAYVVNGTYEFKYYNGNLLSNTENIPPSCQVNTHRSITVTKDTVLPALCFSGCYGCYSFAGIKENSNSQNINLYPNPTNSYATLQLYKNDNYTISINDVLGRTLRSYYNYTSNSLKIDKNDLAEGIYYVSAINSSGLKNTAKLVIE